MATVVGNAFAQGRQEPDLFTVARWTLRDRRHGWGDAKYRSSYCWGATREYPEHRGASIPRVEPWEPVNIHANKGRGRKSLGVGSRKPVPAIARVFPENRFGKCQSTLERTAMRQGLDAMTDESNETRICADCGDEFILTAADREFFERRALYLPKRCVGCRKLRRLTTEAAAMTLPYGREARRG